MKNESYWQESKRPIYSLVFLLPLIAVYEVSMFFAGGKELAYIRSGADVLVKTLLYLIGAKGFFLCSGFFVILVLIILQVESKSPWSVKTPYLFTMLTESLFYSFILFFFALLLGHLMLKNSIGGEGMNLYAQVILSLGAGVYEEFVFRLLLIGFFSFLFSALLPLPDGASKIIAAILSSIIFSLCHYAGPFGDTLEMSSFLYRTSAGIILSIIFITRGFGIAAGSHACYDIIVSFIQRSI